jgi:hypothetical protein
VPGSDDRRENDALKLQPRGRERGAALPVTAIRVWEVSPPEGERPLEWPLVTLSEATRLDSAIPCQTAARRRGADLTGPLLTGFGTDRVTS